MVSTFLTVFTSKPVLALTSSTVTREESSGASAAGRGSEGLASETAQGAVLSFEPTSVPFGPVPLASGPQSSALVVDATNVYWAGNETVMSVPIKGGTVTTLAPSPDLGVSPGIAFGRAYLALDQASASPNPTAAPAAAPNAPAPPDTASP